MRKGWTLSPTGPGPQGLSVGNTCSALRHHDDTCQESQQEDLNMEVLV